MSDIASGGVEIESFNMSDLDVSGLDVRLELTAIIPQVRTCVQRCDTNCVTLDGCSELYCGALA
jgi:hypothetical protein